MEKLSFSPELPDAAQEQSTPYYVPPEVGRIALVGERTLGKDDGGYGSDGDDCDFLPGQTF